MVAATLVALFGEHVIALSRGELIIEIRQICGNIRIFSMIRG